MNTELRCILDVLIAAVLGFAIGFERMMRSKEAGIRTHTIVSIGSALFMVLSKYAFLDTPGYDPARIAAQIVPGIGFLGAGIIVFRKREVYGLTTAAGVWATAGVGMACGARMYILAACATVLLIVIQLILHTKWKFLHPKKMYRLNICFQQQENEAYVIKDLFKVAHFYRFHADRRGEEVFCEATLFTETEYSSEQLNEIMKENAFITSIQRVDEE